MSQLIVLTVHCENQPEEKEVQIWQKKVFCKTSDDKIPCSSGNQGIPFEPNGCVSWQKRVNRFNSREQEEAQWNTRSNGQILQEKKATTFFVE